MWYLHLCTCTAMPLLSSPWLTTCVCSVGHIFRFHFGLTNDVCQRSHAINVRLWQVRQGDDTGMVSLYMNVQGEHSQVERVAEEKKLQKPSTFGGKQQIWNLNVSSEQYVTPLPNNSSAFPLFLQTIPIKPIANVFPKFSAFSSHFLLWPYLLYCMILFSVSPSLSVYLATKSLDLKYPKVNSLIFCFVPYVSIFFANNNFCNFSK